MPDSLIHQPPAETRSLAPTSAASAPSQTRLFWLGSALLLGAFLWLYFPTFQWLLNFWNYDEYYAHGPFLPFISAFLIWQKRDLLRLAWSQRPQLGAVPSGLIFVALLMQVLGSSAEIRSIQALQAFSIPLFLIGVARYMGGPKFARPLVFPLLFLFLAVPMSGPLVEKLTLPLQSYAASVSGMMLGLLGMPIEREGVNLYTPLYHFVVAVPCSGLKIGITLFTMGVLIAHIMPNLTGLQRFGLAFFSLPVALLANTLRVMAIITLGFHYGSKVAEGFLHSWSGLFMFALSLALLLSVGAYLGQMSRSQLKSPNPS